MRAFSLTDDGDDGDPADSLVLFWKGFLSQWYPCEFEVDGVVYANAEQYMMAGKARLFGDDEMLEAILAETSPRKIKGLGRCVRNFDDKVWKAECLAIVEAGNVAKFSQSEELAAALLATGTRTIAEASPYDKIWGIGLAPNDRRALSRKNWRGSNLLGKALMAVRRQLAVARGLEL
ncbi:hypothetical protein, variant [Thecamonas trahens ATCC 50062]|uniref:NADAR domain-containing protein n=1 Tax=Thecamonas trahens ATCC 50062 TaxID=461836 RepID=A0A0L0DL67_THETB|nr:hypothetical protein, variant [Thecamonas trahens ATCC 50062]KNC52123.1 hypothetical protein, variant [Thecamonas trahens ATCC 50062]|eukprot:XP_013762128.1 hypothetical protein, variant [Thecamonas trahens ATCC 50062]